MAGGQLQRVLLVVAVISVAAADVALTVNDIIFRIAQGEDVSTQFCLVFRESVWQLTFTKMKVFLLHFQDSHVRFCIKVYQEGFKILAIVVLDIYRIKIAIAVIDNVVCRDEITIVAKRKARTGIFGISCWRRRQVFIYFLYQLVQLGLLLRLHFFRVHHHTADVVVLCLAFPDRRIKYGVSDSRRKQCHTGSYSCCAPEMRGKRYEFYLLCFFLYCLLLLYITQHGTEAFLLAATLE